MVVVRKLARGLGGDMVWGSLKLMHACCACQSRLPFPPPPLRKNEYTPNVKRIPKKPRPSSAGLLFYVVQNNRDLCSTLRGKRVCLNRGKQRPSSGFERRHAHGTQCLRQHSCQFVQFVVSKNVHSDISRLIRT